MDQTLNDSCNSTPFVSAPSSPSRETITAPTLTAFYHSAPSSPMHFLLSTTASLNSNPTPSSTSFDTLFEFDLPSTSLASADELFFNGQIRRRTRSFDLRVNEHQKEILNATENDDHEERSNETTPRSSSAGRNSSKKWVFLKEFLSRSKSEGRNQERHKKSPQPLVTTTTTTTTKKGKGKTGDVKKKAVNNINNNNNNKNLRSAHEVHYTTKRAQAEEMRKRTFLPYRQGLLSCLSFGSKGYGAMNGFAKALNPVSSTSLSS